MSQQEERQKMREGAAEDGEREPKIAKKGVLPINQSLLQFCLATTCPDCKRICSMRTLIDDGPKRTTSSDIKSSYLRVRRDDTIVFHTIGLLIHAIFAIRSWRNQ